MCQISTRVGLSVLLIIFIFALLIQPSENFYITNSHGAQKVNPTNFDQTYSSYNSLLNSYVKDAKVNYQGFIDNKAEFELFLDTLGAVNEQDFETWTEEEQLAYWINAYNAFTIKAIIDHYPIKRSFSLVGIFYAPSNSILQIKGVWKKLEFKALGKMVTLDEIEHRILRKKYNEPRIHMAINCASISCPDLRGEAYTAEKLEEQLSDASVIFVNDPQKGVFVNLDNRKVKFSKIFKWFGDDFITNYGSKKLFNNYSLKENAVLNFIADYIESEEVKEYLMNNKLKIGYLGYDWNLNETEPIDTPSS